MYLDGADDYLDLDGLTLTTSSANYSFSFWFKSQDGTADHRFFGIIDNTTNDRLNLYMDATTISSYSFVSAGGTVTTFSTSFVAGFEDGTWHHAAMVITSGTGVVLYLDGQLVTASQTMRNVDLSNAGLFKLGGGNDGTNTIAGNICHFGVWHAALTQAQIRSLMTATTYAEAITKGGSTPRAYYLLEADADDSASVQDGTFTNDAVIVGERARLPNGYDLSMTDGVPNQMNAQCFSGRAWAGDGTGDKISCGTTLGDDLGDNYSGSFSVSFWAKNSENDGSNNDGVHELNGAGDSNHGTHAAYYFNSTIRFALDGNAWYRACDLVGVEWHHFVMVYTAGSESDSKVYIDGLEVSGTTSGTFPAAADLDFAGDTLHLGLHYAAATDLNGSISDWKFFKIALTAAQALELYQKPEQILPTGATAANLRSYYSLDDYDIASANSLNGLYVQDSGALGAPGLCTNGGMEFNQPSPLPQLGLRSSSSLISFGGPSSGDYCESSDTDLVTNTFSFSIWVNAFSNAGNYQCIVSGVDTGQDYDEGLNIDLGSGASAAVDHINVEGQGFTKADQYSGSIPFGEWFHLAFTSDDSDYKTYINGSEVNSASRLNTTANKLDIIRLGARYYSGGVNATSQFDGLITDCGVFDAVLDADSVAAIHGAGIGADIRSDIGNYDQSSALVHFWKTDNPATCTDLKGSNDMTVNGTPNMVTVPEGTTEGLSTLGSLTNPRRAWALAGINNAITGYNVYRGVSAVIPQIPWSTSNFTLAFWFYQDAYPGNNAAICGDRETAEGLMLHWQDSTTFRIWVQGDGDYVAKNVTVTAGQSIGTWVQVVLRREGASTLSYVYHPLDQTTVTATDETGTDPGDVTADTDFGFRVGCCGTTPHETGNQSGARIAFFRVWLGTAISDAEVDALYESGARMLRGDS